MDAKIFIKTFNFDKPDWDGVPEEFPVVDREGLTKEEMHLLDAIEIAWVVSRPNSFYIKRMLSAGIGTMTVVTVLIGITMISYYVNVEYDLGLTFLTEFFA